MYRRRPAQVHEAILEDLVYPTEVVGKRVRYKTDASKTLKARLAPASGCVEPVG